MEIITGYTGKPHVTSEQDRDVNIGVVGEKSYVLQTGMQLAAEVSSNNEIKIRDGVLMHQGCTASIKKNTYDSLTIINGSQGMKRIDLIVARYEKNQDNGIESLDLKVIQGTPAESTPTVPEYTEGDIQAGDYVADMPMYQVIINGLNITEVKKVCEVAPDIDALKKEIAELNSKIPHFYNGEIILYYYSTTWLYAREFVGKEFEGCYPQVTCLYRDGQPNQQTIMISAREVDSDGYLVIWAYGGGYVSGHMLGVSVSICK